MDKIMFNLVRENLMYIIFFKNDRILAKILATGFSKVLPFIIHEDQTGLLKRRYVGANIRFVYKFN